MRYIMPSMSSACFLVGLLSIGPLFAPHGGAEPALKKTEREIVSGDRTPTRFVPTPRALTFESSCSSREPWAARADSQWNTVEIGFRVPLQSNATLQIAPYTHYNCGRP